MGSAAGETIGKQQSNWRYSKVTQQGDIKQGDKARPNPGYEAAADEQEQVDGRGPGGSSG
jgi:hypothetical protein